MSNYNLLILLDLITTIAFAATQILVLNEWLLIC